jgi:ATP-dependent protease HslVU (ClpYQ) peptidase subunit
MTNGKTALERKAAKYIVAALILPAVILPAPAVVNGEEFNVNDLVIDTSHGNPTELIEEMQHILSMLDSVLAKDQGDIGADWRRNLFQPLVKVYVEDGDKIGEELDPGELVSPEPELKGIIIGSGGAFALFGDIAVKVGDRLGNWEVASITLDRIVLVSKHGKREIVLE